MQVQQLVKEAVALLVTTSESPQADAEILLAHCLHKTRTWLYTWPDHMVSSTVVSHFRQLVTERQRGVPVAYLIGQRDFWSLTLKVTPATLIPRPETELMVETALTKLPKHQALQILDLGTGTGAIALALARECPQARIIAVDYSAQALQVATENAQLNAIANITFQQSNWFEQLSPQHFDLIVSNPPYIAAHDPHLQQGDVRFEPRSALVAAKNGLNDIEHIIKQAPHWLKVQGWLLLEHGYNQGEAVAKLLQQKAFTNVDCLVDLAGNPRLSIGQWLNV